MTSNHKTYRAGRPEGAPLKLFDAVKRTDNLADELFPEELEALQEMKKRQICEHYSDRFIMMALFARKFNLDRTQKLLERNWKWRIDRGYEELPEMDELTHVIFNSGFAVPGARDKEGRYVGYLYPGKLVPSELPIPDAEAWLCWFYGYAIEHERMDAFRNGFVFVQDYQDYGWKNFDIKFQQALTTVLQDTFPILLKKILLINPPTILKAIIAICKVFMKKKIMDRIAAIELDDLKDIIDVDMLPKQFGGNMEFDPDTQLRSLREWNVDYRLSRPPKKATLATTALTTAAEKKAKKNKKKKLAKKKKNQAGSQTPMINGNEPPLDYLD